MSYLFIYFLLIHWLADFVCQTDWMATNKSKSFEALSSHIIIYTIVLFLGLSALYKLELPISNFLLFISINGFTHLIIDFITSRITSTLYKSNDTHNFFVIIGLDQLAHISILFATYQYYIGHL